MSNTIFNFIYIAVIILGCTAVTLSLVLRLRERDRQSLAILLFVGSMFVYMIIDFVTFYFLNQNVSGGLALGLITFSDILFSGMIVSWLALIVVLFHIEDRVRIKWIGLVTVIYLVLSQALSLWLGRYDSYLIVEGGVGKMILQMFNIAYVIFVIILCIVCNWIVYKKYPSGGTTRAIRVLLTVPLMLYMVWVAYWDYTTWYKTEDNLNRIYGMDPLLLLYALVSLFLIYYFYKKDPLKLGTRQVAPEDAVAVIARKYDLSTREEEVLNLLNQGQSNPQIAGELSISENTVKRHINHIFRKTETQSRHEIIFKISNVTKIDL